MRKSEPRYFDGLHYDRQFGDYSGDIKFYVDMAKKYGEPVLELACGTGRIAVRIGQKNIRIKGIDISYSMLKQAWQKVRDMKLDCVEFIKGDIRDFNLKLKFRLIFFPFNSIAFLHDRQSIESCFRCVREHLEPQGRFIIDHFNPDFRFLARDSNNLHPIAEYPDPHSKNTVTIYENNKYNRSTQINHIKWFYKIGQNEYIEELDMRIIYPQEFDALLHYNGFEIQEKFGDFDESIFNSDSPKQIIVCKVAN